MGFIEAVRDSIYLSIFFPREHNLDLVHTTRAKFENAALFLELGLPSTLIRHENGAVAKRSSNRRNLKTPTFRFSVDGKHLKTELCENDDITIIT